MDLRGWTQGLSTSHRHLVFCGDSVASVNRNEKVVLVPFVHAQVAVLCEQRHDLASLGLLAIVLDRPGTNPISIEGKCPQRLQFRSLLGSSDVSGGIARDMGASGEAVTRVASRLRGRI